MCISAEAMLGKGLFHLQLEGVVPAYMQKAQEN